MAFPEKSPDSGEAENTAVNMQDEPNAGTTIEQNNAQIPDEQKHFAEVEEEVTETDIDVEQDFDHTPGQTEKAVDLEEVQQQASAFSPGYYAILGSFKTSKYAEKLEEQFSTSGYETQLFETRDGWHRVGIFLASSKTEAVTELAQIRNTQNPSAWLLNKRSL